MPKAKTTRHPYVDALVISLLLSGFIFLLNQFFPLEPAAIGWVGVYAPPLSVGITFVAEWLLKQQR